MPRTCPPYSKKASRQTRRTRKPSFQELVQVPAQPSNVPWKKAIDEASCAACWEEVPRQKSCTARQTSSRHASTCVACRITHYSNGHSKTGPWVCLPKLAGSDDFRKHGSSPMKLAPTEACVQCWKHGMVMGPSPIALSVPSLYLRLNLSKCYIYVIPAASVV